MTAAAPAADPALVVTALAQRPDTGSSRTSDVVADVMRAYGATAR